MASTNVLRRTSRLNTQSRKIMLQTQTYPFVFSESVNFRVGPFSEQANKVFTFGIKKTCHMINPDKSYHMVDSAVTVKSTSTFKID